jgi:hypothetical protein
MTTDPNEQDLDLEEPGAAQGGDPELDEGREQDDQGDEPAPGSPG